jgi:hypothetical protein
MFVAFAGCTGEIFRTEITATLDLSDVSYDAAYDCIWIVSDESQKVLKCTKAALFLTDTRSPIPRERELPWLVIRCTL